MIPVKDWSSGLLLHEGHMAHQPHDLPEWSRAKPIRKTHGLTAPQLMRYAADGMIRTSHIRRPGQTRGVRLFHVGDIERLVTSNVEEPKKEASRYDHDGTQQEGGSK